MIGGGFDHVPPEARALKADGLTAGVLLEMLADMGASLQRARREEGLCKVDLVVGRFTYVCMGETWDESLGCVEFYLDHAAPVPTVEEG